MSIRRMLFCTAITLLLGLTAQAATTPVEMLREMFRKPVTEWREILRDSRPLLTDDFFANVEKRIRWGIENNHIDDAFRFAMVGDFGAEVKNKPANFRIDLAELFYKAENTTMSGQIVDNILVTSPNTPAAKRALFLKAQLLEMQKDLFHAHETYQESANKGYEVAECYYKMGLIDMLIEQESRGLQELKKAKEMGHIQAGIEYERYRNMVEGGFDVIAPIDNRPGIDTSGAGTATANQGPDKSVYLAAAQTALDSGDLEEARKNYQGAYKKDSSDPAVLRGMAALLYRMGDLGEARAFLDSALGRQPNDAELWRYRANTCERLFDRKKDSKDLTAALQDYKKAMQLAPNHKFLNSEYQRALAKKK